MALVACPECAKDVSDEAYSCPSCGHPLRPPPAETVYRRFQTRMLVGGLVLCAIGIPVGFAVDEPAVSALAGLGVVVAGIRLAMLRK